MYATRIESAHSPAEVNRCVLDKAYGLLAAQEQVTKEIYSRKGPVVAELHFEAFPVPPTDQVRRRHQK